MTNNTIGKLTIVAVIALCILQPLSARHYYYEDERPRKSVAQVTFAYPLSTHGFKSLDYSNNFSFNILYGLNGGVEGMEIGSVSNYNRGGVSGLQIAGVTNINTGNSYGMIVSGAANILLGRSGGIVIAGGCNYTDDRSGGAYIAPVNISAGKMSGIQIGVVNYARRLKGVQLGVVNISRTEDKAIPVGLINIVKYGLYKFDISTGETMNYSVSYKMGAEHVYNIFKAGYTRYEENPVLALGLGYGVRFDQYQNSKLSVNLLCQQVIYNNNWAGELNLLNTLEVLDEIFISRKASLMLGPTLNVYVTQEKVNDTYGTLPIPYSLYKHDGSTTGVYIWIGLNAGVSLNI